MAFSTTTSLISQARSKVHDRYDSHYVREFLNEQANGVQTVFQLRNRNVVQQADGAPADLVALVNNVVVSITSIDQVTGLVTLAAPPAALTNVEFRYYYILNTDAEYLDFLKTGSQFVGIPPTFTALGDLVQFSDELNAPAISITAVQALRSMASLAHWYYSANAGNKSFNKDSISRKFLDQAATLETAAEKQRSDVYTRFDEYKAPAIALSGNAGLRYWEPRR